MMTPKKQEEDETGVQRDKNGNDIKKKLETKGNSKDEEDPEYLELSKLRCTSLQTEEIASLEKAKQEREKKKKCEICRLSRSRFWIGHVRL